MPSLDLRDPLPVMLPSTLLVTGLRAHTAEFPQDLPPSSGSSQLDTGPQRRRKGIPRTRGSLASGWGNQTSSVWGAR